MSASLQPHGLLHPRFCEPESEWLSAKARPGENPVVGKGQPGRGRWAAGLDSPPPGTGENHFSILNSYSFFSF